MKINIISVILHYTITCVNAIRFYTRSEQKDIWRLSVL